MSKYKVGDKVLLQGEVLRIEKDNIPYPYGIRIAKNIEFMFGEVEIVSKTYEDGLADAWELARKVALYNCDKEDAYSVTELKAIFNKTSLQGVFSSYTIQQALAKIEAYEESKAIKVGDVVYTDDEPDSFGVVTWVAGNIVYVMWEDGSCGRESDIEELHKTGRHIDIGHLLEQIRGNE